MPSRTDQLHSHEFTRQRVINALAIRDSDPRASSTRRGGGAIVASALVAAFALAAVAVYGLLRPIDDPSWRDGKAVIVEQETGARYVLRDGVLHPILNQASALLILGAGAAPPVFVSRAGLAGVPRGVPLGIAGAPDPLPAVANLVTGAWQLCSRSALPGQARADLFIGVPATSSASLADQAVLAVDPNGGQHMLWHGHRYAVRAPAVVLTALGWRSEPATPVAAAMLNATPTGPDLGPLDLPSGVDAESVIAGEPVGQVIVVANQGGARQFAVALADGLAEITQVQADLLLADPRRGLGAPVVVTPARFAALPRAPSLVPTGADAPPATTPQLAHPGPDGTVCASFVDGAAMPILSGEAAPAQGARRGLAAASLGVGLDGLSVPPGGGVVVESSGGEFSVVTDLGIRFPVPSRDVLAVLGYGDVAPLRLPWALVALLPVGRALDPNAAAEAAV